MKTPKFLLSLLDSDEGLEIMRHTLTAQVLARAVKNLFPETKLAIGPTIKMVFTMILNLKNLFHLMILDKIEIEMQKNYCSGSVLTKNSLKTRSLKFLLKTKLTKNLL